MDRQKPPHNITHLCIGTDQDSGSIVANGIDNLHGRLLRCRAHPGFELFSEMLWLLFCSGGTEP
jgi:hypothetical protein